MSTTFLHYFSTDSIHIKLKAESQTRVPNELSPGYPQMSVDVVQAY